MKRFGVLCVTLIGVLGAVDVWGHAAQPGKAQEMKLSVTEAGFVPSSIRVRRGVPIVLLITRKTEKTCATQATFPSTGKTYDLPLNKAVRIDLPAQKPGTISFACGMGMLKGTVLVR